MHIRQVRPRLLRRAVIILVAVPIAVTWVTLNILIEVIETGKSIWGDLKEYLDDVKNAWRLP